MSEQKYHLKLREKAWYEMRIDKEDNKEAIITYGATDMDFESYEVYEIGGYNPVYEAEDLKLIIKFLKENDEEGWNKGVYLSS